jgi:hypothetical protein
MHKKYSKFLIFSFLAVSIFGIYSYFYNDLKSEAAATTTDEEGGLTSSLATDTATTATSSQGSQAAEDTAFLMKLASLKNIKIDTSLFTDQGFMTLVDNNVILDQAPYGRVNPFSPLNNMVVKTEVLVPATTPITKTN